MLTECFLNKPDRPVVLSESKLQKRAVEAAAYQGSAGFERAGSRFNLRGFRDNAMRTSRRSGLRVGNLSDEMLPRSTADSSMLKTLPFKSRFCRINKASRSALLGWESHSLLP